MMRIAVIVLFFVGYSIFASPSVSAEPAIGLQPLQYAETLQKGERKQAFVDITNPSHQPTVVQFSVQGFKQIDDKGTLSFYSDEKISSAILLDYQEREIPAKKTLRLFFVVDGAKLPTGDVFAAIFAQTKPKEGAGALSVRVGTLLILTNGTPSARRAEVTSFTTPLFHFAESITGEIKIKNTAPANTSSGFSPKVTVRMWPFGLDRAVQGPLVFAGNTRTIKLDQPTNLFGIYKISASFDASAKDRWVILVTGVWRWILPLVFLVAVTGFVIYKFYIKPRQSRRR
jgi:hypothetical protein